jgi:hypothetical protein
MVSCNHGGSGVVVNACLIGSETERDSNVRPIGGDKPSDTTADAFGDGSDAACSLESKLG